MLVTLKEICGIAEEKGIGVGAFNVPNLESLTAVLEAAEELNAPVIIQHAEVHDELIPIEVIAPIMVDMAKKASVPVCVHLDHGITYHECMKALRLGFTSVMYDASAAPYEDNVSQTKEVVKAAHAMGASVEAELGTILSGEGSSESREETNLNDIYTDPDTAKDFVERTGVDALAIAFGTAHGIYKETPVLDLDRIIKIREKTDAALVMHGGSGVSDKEFKTAIKNGIRKINYYTYMALAGAEAILKETDGKTGDDHLLFHDLALAGKAGMKENIKKAMNIFLMK